MPAGIPDRGANSQEQGATRQNAPSTLSTIHAPAGARRDTPINQAQADSPKPRAILTLLNGNRAGRLVGVETAGVVIGRAKDVDFGVDDPGVSRRHARVARTGGAFYIEDLGSTNGTFVGAGRIGISLLQGGAVVQLGPQLLLRFALVADEVPYPGLYDSLVHEPLTRLFNRQYLAERLVAEVAHAQRIGVELALLIADVDCLKHMNDRFGHSAGDQALCVVGERMKRALRVEDVLARYGGDEFVIIAPGTSAPEARYLGERIRRAIEQLRMSARGEDIRVTTSIGIASLAEVRSTDEPIGALFGLADARLYAAKAAGRNRVRAANVPA